MVLSVEFKLVHPSGLCRNSRIHKGSENVKQYSYCENCFNTDKSPEICGTCIRNPQNVFKHDNFVSYPICCRYGFKYCFNDPGYIWKYHHDWFIELYGDINPSEIKSCEDCDDCSEYDDEDK